MSGNIYDGLKVDQFDYDLPPELIAQTPLAERDASRLLVIERSSGSISHTTMRDLPELLKAGDLAVANNSRVMAARLLMRKVETGGRAEILLLRQEENGTWSGLARPSKSLRPGMQLQLANALESGGGAVEIVEVGKGGAIRVRFHGDDRSVIAQFGVAPLPPYIHTALEDADRYQTVYASELGSAAAPTAGLHFTPRLIGRLAERGVGWAEVTLHVGLDTFRPVTVERVAEHAIHREWYEAQVEAIGAIRAAKARGGTILAVGTTSARTLETIGATWHEGQADAMSGWTDIFIAPGYRWRMVDAMLTNFHLPRSTLLMMVSSFAGAELIREAYRVAIEHRYRFFSFGDAMLLL